MDQIVSNRINSQQNCIFHPKNKVSFIQVNQISTQPSTNIFQCVDCFEQDLQFKGSNYMIIQKIIENSESEFYYKWPPLNDQQIIQKIHLKAQNLNSSETIINQINSFFSLLKDEIIHKIDISQKKAINRALEMPFGKEQILSKYQEISQIKNFKSLLEDQNKSFDVYQKQCKDFIQQIELQKDKNTQKFQELLDQCDKVQELVNFNRLNQSKQFILDFLDELNIFEDQKFKCDSICSYLNTISLQQQENTKINQIMQLISNKTNFCSDEFLSEIRQQMQKLSIFFEQISFDKMNQPNYKAIPFSELNDEQINSINGYVEHLIKIQNNHQYLQQVQNSQQMSTFINIFDNKFNFISDKYRDNLIEYLVDTYTFQKNLNTVQVHSEESSFNCLRRLETNYVQEFVKLVKTKQNLDENQQNFANSETQRIQQEILKQFRYEQNDLEQMLKQFPIFDLIKIKQYSNLNELQFFKSNLRDGNQRLEIVKNMNNQFEISINETNYQGKYQNWDTNCISQKLERDKKYIFRFQFKKGSEGYFKIGLMQNKNFNNDYGYLDKMSYYFCLENNKMKYNGDCGIEKFMKGNKEQQLDENSTLELRAWLEGKQLEVLEYPNYNYQVQLKDEYQQNLLQQDLCLYLYLQGNQDKCILKESFIVDQF